MLNRFVGRTTASALRFAAPRRLGSSGSNADKFAKYNPENYRKEDVNIKFFANFLF